QTIARHQASLAAEADADLANTAHSADLPDDSSHRLSVHFRTRPLSIHEEKLGLFQTLFCTRNATQLYYPSFRVLVDSSVDVQQFAFDANYPGDAPNELVYAQSVQRQLHEAIQHSGILTVMCSLTPTGSGKTYTMFSVAEQLVNDLPLDDSDTIQATISIIEIQGDTIRDLSVIPSKSKTSLQCRVMLDDAGVPVLVNVQQHAVTTREEVLDLFHTGFESRSTRSTLKNAASSRSHFICTIRLTSTEDDSLNVTIKLVDLAGSETGSDKKDHDAVRLKESIAINKSLMSLKDCIRKSASTTSATATSSGHIPFRSSKLTMVLKDSLDPTSSQFSSTVVFALAAPTIADVPHTFNTYRYALALKSLNQADDDGAAMDILQHKSAIAGIATGPSEKSTPMAWSRLKLDRWINTQFENQLELYHLLGPKGDPLHYGRPAVEFVLPPWKFIYEMTAQEWVANAKTYGKYNDEATVTAARDKYRKLFIKERATVAAGDGLGGVAGKVTSLALEEDVVPAVSGAGEGKRLTRADIAMAKARAKGAALRAAKA
ncbi:P-loop containing nucleoside triphosphate hydrolase protein, partial [Chytriomyces sp. MP71]